MAGLDLSGVAEVLASWIVDEVQIVRGNGAIDDVLDEETGDLEAPDGLLLYEDVGLIKPEGDGYTLMLPLGSNIPLIPGDQVRVIAARGFTTDPQIVTRQFQVAALPPVTSLAVAEVTSLVEVGWAPGLFPEPGEQDPVYLRGQDMVEDPDDPGFYVLED